MKTKYNKIEIKRLAAMAGITSSMSTVLIIGATSGIGESFARTFHKMGKQVIITGRREDRLSQLAQELPGLSTYAMDNSDLAAIPGHIQTILSSHPRIDTVWVNSGIGNPGNFKSLDAFSDEKIIAEINVNLAAPIIFARYFIPHLLALQRPGNFMATSSGMAFVPNGMVPVYSASKAGLHSFLVCLRQSLKDANVSVIEVAPPAVRTHVVPGRPSNPNSMELDDFTRQTLETLNQPASTTKESAVGSAATRVEAWRKAFDPFLLAMGRSG